MILQLYDGPDLIELDDGGYELVVLMGKWIYDALLIGWPFSHILRASGGKKGPGPWSIKQLAASSS